MARCSSHSHSLSHQGGEAKDCAVPVPAPAEQLDLVSANPKEEPSVSCFIKGIALPRSQLNRWKCRR